MRERITPHFYRDEFQCKCQCGGDTVDVNLAKALNLLRLHFNKPVTINSGFRCKAYNKKIGGSKKSQHMTGKAADIKVKDVSARKVQLYLKDMYPDRFGVGSYKRFTHLDVRSGGPVRWKDD